MTPNKNRWSHLKGTVNHKMTAEAKAPVRTPENRQKKQREATTMEDQKALQFTARV